MHPWRALAVLVVALTGALRPPLAEADEDVVSSYVGVSIGRSQINVDSVSFLAHETGWKAFAGVRALKLVGAEAEYVDFGHPRMATGFGTVDAKASGAAVFAVAYLPIPVPFLDVFGKAGVHSIHARATVTLAGGATDCAPNAGCGDIGPAETGFAWGGGAQLKLQSFGARAEFEQFRTSGGRMNLVSAGFFWSFF